MNVVRIILAVYFTLTVLIVPFAIGKPRKPITAGGGVFVTAVAALTAYALWVA